MFKSIRAAFAAALLLGPVGAQAAGTLPIAMAQQMDINGQPVVCTVNFFQAGTVSTPQNSYSDFGLSLNPNNQLSCDQTGRVPMFWLADGLVHVRMIDASGVPIIDTTMQVLGPSSGGGGGGSTVDPTTILATGDMKARYGTGVLSGFVRANGLTIGNAACGCSERSNGDTQTLWVYLYATDPNLSVSGGRTGNALNDYNANKQLALPDWRGRALAFLDDMGNSAAGNLTASYFGTAATVLGAAGGAERETLVTSQVPTITSSNGAQAITVNAGGIIPVSSGGWSGTAVGSGVNTGPFTSGSIGSQAAAITGTNNITVTSNNTGGGTPTPFITVQPTRLATIYVKL